ncbi:MAG TPA: alpha/beta hydrolase [Xanthomonadaceae bacterium]|nr:alpha/beta hydrolase [Xanthomonadaceae bacterium]
MDPSQTGEFIDVDGARVHMRRIGAGPPLLLIHGLGSCGADWAFQVPALAPHFELMLPDLPGSGHSTALPEGVTIDRMAGRLWQSLDRLGVERPAVIGFSLGGAVALEMALQRPAAVARLALLNSLPSYRVDHWRKAFEVLAQITLVRLLGLKRTGRIVAGRLFPPPVQAPMRERVVQVLAANDRRQYLATIRALVGWCALDRLHRLKVPTLMLASEHDYTPLAEKRRFAEHMGAHFHWVRGARHGLPFDSIVATNAAVLAWLRGDPVDCALCADDPECSPAYAAFGAYQSI